MDHRPGLGEPPRRIRRNQPNQQHHGQPPLAGDQSAANTAGPDVPWFHSEIPKKPTIVNLRHCYRKLISDYDIKE
jgi:hypothetical protein